jgi:NitT/TauT family transport system substrate-binding protein
MSQFDVVVTERRRFLIHAFAFGGATFLGLPSGASAEVPPETRTIRFGYDPVICVAPMFLAEQLLGMEGFTRVEYVQREADETFPDMLVSGKVDLGVVNTPSLMLAADAGKPISMIAGIHAGCFELFANERIRAIRDLKGKRIAVSVMGSGEHVYIASMLAYVGMDPKKDVDWVTARTVPDSMRLFIEGKADAFLGFPPQPQELRARQVGHVIVNTTLDRPWSQYFCCVAGVHREFAARNPIATKRALRALLKATDLCAEQPDRAARHLVTKGYEPRYDVALEVVKSLDYRQWRDYEPEDTVRFHALRLHDAGLIKTSPKELIARATDWRFLNELKKELKA